MVRIDEHIAEMEKVKELMKTARGKRLYDLQTYYKRLKKELAEARFYESNRRNL